MSQLFISGDQIIGASCSASVLPMKIQHWFPLGRTGLISLLSRGLSRVFSSTTLWKDQFFDPQPSLWSNSHIHTWLLENHSFDYMDLCQQRWIFIALSLGMFPCVHLVTNGPFRESKAGFSPCSMQRSIWNRYLMSLQRVNLSFFASLQCVKST